MIVYEDNTEIEIDLKEIMQTCRDILLDIKDEHSYFVYSVSDDSNWVHSFLKEPGGIKISISNECEFKFQDIENVISRLNCYMQSIGWIGFFSKEIKRTGFYYCCALRFQYENF